jgi:hypothetical protein
MRFVVLFGLSLSWTRSAAALQADSEGVEFFEKRIRPVLVERCYSCHSAQPRKSKGNLRLDSREGLLRGGDRGPSIAVGDPGKSLLLKAIRHADDDLKMPPKASLPEAQIADFESWIRKGASWPAADAAKEGIPPPAASRHWAFEPPREGAPPPVKDRAWVRGPIDAFILARLEDKGLAPAPPADPRTLLRRASFDLIGLPPTAEETESFLADPSSDAYERAVDRLLASPRYGERWARYWLDVARYADTTDYDANGAVSGDVRLVQSAHYRDWVIRALNEDLPYDQFLVQQIAADQLGSKEENAPLAAMGFLTIGRRFTGNAQDIIDDRLDVICRGTMGLTMGCARCHDHKFDPIPTRDYYSLYGIFQASKEKTVGLPGAGDDASAYEAELRGRRGALLSFQRATGEAVKRHLRSRIADYFAALVESEEETSSRGLHPFLVRALKEHLARTKKEFHPIFAAWHALSEIPGNDFEALAPERLRAIGDRLHPRVAAALAKPGLKTLREAAQRYGAVFAEVEAASADDELHAALAAFPPLAKSPESLEEFFDNRAGYEVSYLKSKIARWEMAGAGAPPRAVILEDIPPKENPRIFKRGNPASPGDSVPRQFLEVLCEGRREPFTKGSGRLEFARAIASPENPLTARVIVNRIWLHHFGAGLVRTPSDFGIRSEPPTHPELLDLLARRFVQDQWSIKKLHRLIMNSSAYRQSSRDNPEARRIDPENRLLWRMCPRRLDFESLRDSLLAVAGALDITMGGPAEVLTSQPHSRRRSVYGFVDRLDVSNLLLSFDFANPASHSPQRHATTVPQQALFMMNSPFILEQARRIAGRPEFRIGMTPDERIQALYRVVLGRAGTPREVAAGRRFVGSSVPPPEAKPSAWTYGSGEFDGSTGRVTNFQPLPCFTGLAWQSRPYLPDPDLGWIALDATGGRPGDDLRHAVIRRWVAPRDGMISIRGSVRLLYDPDVYQGSIRVRVITSRTGELLSSTVERGEIPMASAGARVHAGDTVDFLAECPAQVAYSQFSWAPVIEMQEAGQSWRAEADFGGPQEAPLTPWEEYAQVLLMSNEFLFLD